MAKARKVVRTKYLYRSSRKKKIRNIILFLLLAAILVGIGYLVSMEWSKRFGSGAPQSSYPDVSIPSVDELSSEETSSETSSAPLVPVTALRTRLLPAADMAKPVEELAAYFGSLREEGYNAVAFDCKTSDGVITYDTRNELALSYGTVGDRIPGGVVSASPVSLDTLVKAAQDAGLTPVARLSALRDGRAANAKDRQNSYTYETPNGPNWLDNRLDLGGRGWLNPYMPNARGYIAGLCGELSERGIKQIILTDVRFPDQFTNQLNEVDPYTTREAVLAQLMNEARAAAGEDAAVYAAFTPGMLAEYGTEGIRGLGPDLAPLLDAADAQKASAALKAGILPTLGSDPSVTVENEVFRFMLGDTFTQLDSGEARQVVLLSPGYYETVWKGMENDAVTPETRSVLVDDTLS